VRALSVRKEHLRGLSLLFALVASLFVLALPAAASGVVPDAIWANGRLYGTVATPTNLPNNGPFNQIYNFAGSGLAGQRSISDSAPSLPNFYGGRWEVHFVSYTPAGLAYFDKNNDGRADFELTSNAQLMSYVDMGYITVDPTVARRFVCTMNPLPK
jgi:hypothetical protein